MNFLSSPPIETILSLALAIVAIAPVTALALASSEEPGTQESNGIPAIACSLTSPELRERIIKIRRDLLPHVIKTIDLPNGIGFLVPNEDGQIQRLAEFVELESRCCAFLDFEMRVEAESTTISLQMTGPEGTKEVLEAMALSLVGP